MLEGVENGAHIHGPAGPGQIALPQHFLAPGPIKNGVWNYSPGYEVDLLAGRFYVNIHSDIHPQGAIRGQITPLVAVPAFQTTGFLLALAALTSLGLFVLWRRGRARLQ